VGRKTLTQSINSAAYTSDSGSHSVKDIIITDHVFGH